MKKRNTTIWILLIVSPVFILIGTALLQMLIRFALSGATETVFQVMNLISFIIGLFAVLALIGTPIWIIMLVRSISFNNQLKSTSSRQQKK